jgi:phage-related protein
MENTPRLRVAFYRSGTGREPVREWLKALPRVERKAIGEEIKTVQFGWPLGMPLVRKMEPELWEVRIRHGDGIARIFFTLEGDVMVLLHAFIKKGRKTPKKELAPARKRLAQVKGRK